MDFKKELEVFLLEFEPYERGFFSKRLKFASKYHPLIVKLYRDLFDFSRRGKKLRAFLVYLGWRLGKGKDIKMILPIALAYELVHSFLLIHDDIIDQSEVRRGKPTIHKRYEKLFGPSTSLRASEHYGVSQALILGNIAFLEALGLINFSRFSQNQKLLCQRQLVNTILETCYGEGLDVEYSYKSASLNQIWKMTELKTAKYTFIGPLILGATFAGIEKRQSENLTKFGLFLGKAFQLHDDFLGIFGDEKVMGKSILSDMREGKNTVLIHKARQTVKGRDKKELEQIWGKRSGRIADLKVVRKIISDCGTLAWCEWDKEKLVKEAKIYIPKITSDINLQNILSQTADFVIRRES
ncbi:hypothetical protein A2165_03405 [Candidatus Curtissbacteria bacterium RBG_13_40_7]|uniref:Polyprenyl synthetase n=1 Tax=Candidatus Curtissbacteria bacterium RBG_13_40_7 TaxID=1797706 RepID=A0A1F5FZ30_9BACT|nr:MAG: hypothetical protein A2165_03405 [Candidatus Curtissbacteria bacterium RBG_13_40_7]